MSIYLDASFLVSLYSADPNSAAAARIMQATVEVLIVTSLAKLEVINAFELRVFRNEITVSQSQASLRDFAADLANGIFHARAIPEACFKRAEQISRRTTSKLGTRTADVLHVAAALELHSGYMYSFDARQRKLAQTMNLKLNPLP